MWPVYLINLDRDARRLANSTREFEQAGIPFERVSAVDGELLTLEDWAHYQYRPTRWPRLLPSEVGCYLSHLRLWEATARNQCHDGAFIFEDDFVLASNARRIMESLGAHDGWDLVKLFSRGFTQRYRLQHQGEYSLYYSYHPPISTLAYGITRDCARVLVDNLSTSYRPLDEHIARYWELGIQIATIYPHPPVLPGDESTASGSIREQRRRDMNALTQWRLRFHRRALSSRRLWERLRHHLKAGELVRK